MTARDLRLRLDACADPGVTAVQHALQARRLMPRWAAIVAVALIQLTTLGAAAIPPHPRGTALPAPPPPPIVILLSWDGVRHDYLDQQTPTQLPALARMQREGMRAEGLRPGWPSTTFPGHAAIATGSWAEQHGIVDNRFFDRRRGTFEAGADAGGDAGADAAAWLNAEPLWIAAERQGVRSATFFWVGAEADWRGQRQRFRRAPFDPDIDEPTKVRQILAWLDLPPAKAPRLIMSWWHGADDAGHEHGPGSDAVREAMRTQDAALDQLLKGIDARRLWTRLTLLLVSDHGMTRVERNLDLAALVSDLGVDATVLSSAGVGHVFVRRPADRVAVERALRNTRGVRLLRNAELPASMHLRHVTRTGDLVVVAQPPLSLQSMGVLQGAAFRMLRWCCNYPFGGHGYDPHLSDMQGIFLAMGRGVRPAQRQAAQAQIDIAPTVALLLGIAPPRNASGRAVPGIDVTATR